MAGFELDKIYNEECLGGMARIPDGVIDLTVTSPPYDSLRLYHGFTFDFEGIARELYRVTKDGGAVVWIVCDATVDGSETGTSFKQALFFKELGFNLHDTMIWQKPGFPSLCSLKTRYAHVFEYMFVLSKGKLGTFNPIKDRPNKCFGQTLCKGTRRNRDGSMKPKGNGKPIAQFGQRFNIWQVNTGQTKATKAHPAIFPEQLAADHIISWSNPGELILDPFMGSGTTAVAAKRNGRNFVGFEISEEYHKIALERLNRLN